MIKVIDNLLPATYATTIASEAKNMLLYRYQEQTSYAHMADGSHVYSNEYTDEHTCDYGQFVSTIVDTSGKPTPFTDYINFLRPLVYSVQDRVPELKLNSIFRCKANILLQQRDADINHYNIPHYDYAASNAWSLVYYTDDCDGDTFMFNEFQDLHDQKYKPSNLTIAQRITPKKNRAVLFQSARYHASSNPIKNKSRFVYNFIFLSEQKEHK